MTRTLIAMTFIFLASQANAWETREQQSSREAEANAAYVRQVQEEARRQQQEQQMREMRQRQEEMERQMRQQQLQMRLNNLQQ